MPQGNARRRRKAVKPKTVQGLKQLIKTVSLKDAETKLSSTSDENVRLFHNGTEYRINLLRTTPGTLNPQGFLENDRNRVGDEVLARGLKIRWWVSNVEDRPNVMYKMYVFWYNTDTTSMTDAQFWRGTDGDGASLNRMVDAANTYKVKPLKSFMIKSGADYSIPDNAKEHSYYKDCYIPLNNRKIRYRVDGNNRPQFKDLGFCVVAYDAFGTLVTDQVASMAYTTTFYFKDS